MPVQWRMSIAAFTMFRSGQGAGLFVLRTEPTNLVIPNVVRDLLFGCPILVAPFATGWELRLWLLQNM